MRKITLSLLLITTIAINAQLKKDDQLSILYQPDKTVIEWNSDGRIKSVRYAATDENIPETANDFFTEILNKEDNDAFTLDRFKETDYGMRFERYQQYYKGVVVVDGHYNFRFKNGMMKVVKGHYVNAMGLNTVPSITGNEAINIYNSYFKIKKNHIIETHLDLIIKEIPSENRKGYVTALTYRVFIHTTNMESSYIGYIDAHTGKLLYIEQAYFDYSTIGQFYTYYNRNVNDTPKTGITDYSNGRYYLKDTTRGYGIYTKIINPQYQDPILPSDDDNIWTRAEMGSYNIALDVHWTMENIYDVLEDTFNHNSYNGNGSGINSYIVVNTENASYSPVDNSFTFGNAYGSSVFDPFASVDIIGHEFGHALLCKTALFSPGQAGEQKSAIHEGLADIWGIIFEKHITPSASYWKTGEQIMINGESCMRNFMNPGDMTAHAQISSTYGYGLYNSSDPHIKGGLLPYWFYLLSNGGSGTNGLSNNYQLVPVGFTLAEQLFASTTLTSAYLEDCTTFSDLMYAFIDAADDMNNPFLVEQVQNTWYAVGLNSEPLHIYLQSYAPGSATYYVFGNTNCTVSWSYTNISGSLPSLTPNNSNYSCTVNTSSNYSGHLNATIYCGGKTVTYSRYISGAASPSSSGDDIMQFIPLDKTHYQISLYGNHDNCIIKVYDALSLQIKVKEKMVNENCVLDISSWKRGMYVVEINIGNKTYTKKISIK